MSIGREQIYSSLFDLLVPLGPLGVGSPPMFNTVSRRVVPLSQLTPEMLPALFQSVSPGESYVYRDLAISAPPVVTLYANLLIVNFFSAAVAQDVTPDTIVNNLMDQVEDALQQPGGVDNQTLGNLVEWARLEGHMTELIPTSSGNWAISTMVVALLVNN